MENEKGHVVIYDGINTQAWLGTKPDKKGVNYALSKKFKNNKLARSYAFKLSNKYKAPIFDKDYGKYIGKYSQLKTPVARKSTGLLTSLGFGGGRKTSTPKKSMFKGIFPF